MKKTPDPASNHLRQKAEELLKHKPARNKSELSEAEALRLIHELEVHQVELEIQNEELRLANAKANDATELYDFAPTGYFTLSRDGEILGLNLSGAAMLGRERSRVINSRFAFFISNDTKPAFQIFLDKVFGSTAPHSCEVILQANGNSLMYVHLSAVVSGKGSQCLLTAVDITEHKSLEALNEVLLTSLPYPAMYIRKKDMVVLATNKHALAMGVKIGGHCWRKFMKAEYISGKDKLVAARYPDLVPAEYNITCTFCLAEKCFVSALEQNDPGLNAFGEVWDTYWIRVSDEVFLHYAVNISERKKDEKQIQMAHERLRRFVDSDIVGIIIADSEGKVIETNDYYLNVLGYSRADFEAGNVNWREITPPEWLNTDERAIVELRENGKCTPYEKEYIRKDGSRCFVLITDALLPGPEMHIAGFILDITKRKKTEIALRESELKYRELIENSPDAIVIHSKGEILLANKEACNLMAVDRAEDILGKQVLQFVHPDYREMVIDRMKKMSEDGLALPLSEERFVRPNGSEVVVEVKAIPILFENEEAVQLIIRDITKRKEAEDAIRNSELNFRELFEANTDGITIFNINPDGLPTIILDMNENSARMLGYTKDELLHLTPTAIEKDSTSEKIERRMNDLLSKGFSNFETIIQHKDGHEIEADIKVMMINYNNQPALMNIVRDITDRKNSEIQLQKYAIELNKQIAEKDKFFSIIAHDLRGPFNGFLELSEMMAEESASLSMDDMRKIAGIMKKSATNLFRLLGNLLEWSRMQRGITSYDPRPVILNAKIHEITNLAKEAASKKGITVNYSIPADLEVFADENMLEGILRNLVANAVKYTNTGGSVTISAKYSPGESVEFSIKDTGIGMNSTILENLFNLNVNTSRKGTAGELSTGLGLIICKDFIEKHHGVLRIESEVGQGSTFFFTIPGPLESVPQNTRSDQATDNPSDQARKLNILIAEDEETSDLLISIALAKISRESYHAKTGLEAIEACHVHPDIDLILMDIQMPLMDGYEATRQIRLFNKDVIIIAQTAYTYSNDREKALEAGCNDYISKPISQKELMEVIRKHIRE
ncbi:MAG: PAS domain S-box protein [Bacteroidales bacterium]|nr:PAS domain S-box protein [Bacteroidales bacterium]